MRLLEIKNRLQGVLTGNQIVIDATPIYGGNAYQITNSRVLFTSLELLSQQPWNKLDFDLVDKIAHKYNAKVNSTISIDQTEYNELSAYVTSINQYLPIFFGIVDGVSEAQSPQDINIKLSEGITSVEALSQLTSQLDDLVKLANIDGKGILFKGFDKGTSWIVLTVIGPVAYTVIIKCLHLAQEVLKTKSEYYGSKKAELDYRAALKDGEEHSKDGQEQYQEKRTKVQVELGVQEIQEQIKDTNGFADNEVTIKLTKTVNCMIDIVGEGNELHLSLNPPKEATETVTGIVDVDYSYLEKGTKAMTKPKELGITETAPDANQADK